MHRLAASLAILLLSGPAAPAEDARKELVPPANVPVPQAKAPRAAPAETDFAFLGLQTKPAAGGERPGALAVSYIYTGSAAEEMGFRLGDEIVSVNDFLVPDQPALVRELRKLRIDSTVRFGIRRAGAEQKISGKIGSYAATMRRFQDALRKRHLGKPLPRPPEMVWWNPETGAFESRPDGWKPLEGKVSVVGSFDDCKTCREGRISKLMQVRTVMAAAARERALGFVGVYYDERPGKSGKDASLESAAKLFAEIQPAFPVGVAYYPAGTDPKPEEQFLLHNHGIAILDEEGAITYLQILGLPATEFITAYEGALYRNAPPKAEPEAKPQ